MPHSPKSLAPDPEADRLSKFLSLAVKAAVWGLFFFVLYLLRSFFLLIFLTFVFAYIQVSGIQRLEKYISSRVVRVVLVAAAFLILLLSIGALVIPRVKQQAGVFVQRLPTYIQTMDEEIIGLTKAYPLLAEAFNVIDSEPAENSRHDLAKSPTLALAQSLFGADSKGEAQRSMATSVSALRDVGEVLLAGGSAFLLALLFSFLIVLDLPKLAGSVRSLAETKIAYIYDEVAHSIAHFGAVMGRAIQAQLYIALLNTVLTALGLLMLGIGNELAFLSVIVFFCSFIPVAGVFISSVPICLLALQQGGFQLMVLAIILITIVHMIEAYILNPRIYGHHMRLNPVIVLIILTIGGKLFHIWGLILGVPICTYIFGHAIQRTPTD